MITVFPWNMHFRAKEIIHDAAHSEDKGIALRAEDVTYTKRIAKRYLVIALSLHAVSAIVFYVLAYTGITPIGYIGAGAALMLTLLRPAIRMHDYIIARLQHIGQQIRYPREDVAMLRSQVSELSSKLEILHAQLDLEESTSWASQQKVQLVLLEEKLSEFYTALDKLKMQNQVEHERLSRKAEESIAALSEDAKFLNQVRELIRFVKSA